jgi:replication factor C subunit 3/5
MNRSNEYIPWVEKYRPTEFDNIVLDPTNRKLFVKIIEKGYFPNLLFYGPPGTGKTTTIINIIKEYQLKYSRINQSNVIHLNASDERGIDIIRNQINSFVKSRNLFETGTKFVILDEVDYMTKNAQQALKYLLQTTITNVRFCLICNYISKIDEPLKQEFIGVRFNQLPSQDIMKFMKTIADSENIDITSNAIQTIQSMYKSDIRSMINFLQINQHLKENEWKTKIVDAQILDTIHELFCTETNFINIAKKIQQVSENYNNDKNALLLMYFNHIIRENRVKLTIQLVEFIEQIVHSPNSNIDDIIHYIMANQDIIVRSPYECVDFA